jgi:NAD-dependent deacetylase
VLHLDLKLAIDKKFNLVILRILNYDLIVMSLSDLSKLQELIKQNKNFVLLSGAGVSTASGVPDFRSEHGLYKKFKNAEYLLSHEALVNEPSAFFDFYKKQMLLKNIKPNLIHQKIAA